MKSQMLKNKNAIITGSNRGLGKAIVEEFAKNGANIYACARSQNGKFEKHLQNLAEKYKVNIKPIYFDLSDSFAMKEGFKKIYSDKQSIDILVNCAGVAHGGLFQMTPISKIKEIFEINFFSQMEFTQLVLKIMMKQQKGNIINFSSIAGLDLKVGNCAYGVSKAAMTAWTKTISAELAPCGIRVNAIAPALTDTDMAKLMDEKAVIDGIESSAMKRMATPQEIVEVVLFLASDKSSFINGQTIRVDGGNGVLFSNSKLIKGESK